MFKAFTMPLVFTSLLSSGAIFGFFYAWVCSTMWGLDGADPRVAISAMQAMNGSVRNAVFFPAFFLTPVLLTVTACLTWRPNRTSAILFATSALIYFLFGLVLTMVINVPMNEALGALSVPTDTAQAQTIWQDYSPTWQFWNQVRTGASGLSFLIAILGLWYLPSPNTTIAT